MYLFNTPSKRVSRRGDRFWGRLRENISLSVLKDASGAYRTVEEPTNEDVAAAAVAYLGGRTYFVSDDEAAALKAAGYAPGLVALPAEGGYGAGRYGLGAYGEGDPNPTHDTSTTYGSGPYGEGIYG